MLAYETSQLAGFRPIMWALLDVKLVQSSAIRYEQIGRRAIEELVDLPLMSDPASLVTLNVLIKLGAPARFTDANLCCLVICRAVNLSLEGGHCDGSCAAYEVARKGMNYSLRTK
jgi:predicted ATPase